MFAIGRMRRGSMARLFCHGYIVVHAERKLGFGDSAVVFRLMSDRKILVAHRDRGGRIIRWRLSTPESTIHKAPRDRDGFLQYCRDHGHEVWRQVPQIRPRRGITLRSP
jgi:hypothetical protein